MTRHAPQARFDRVVRGDLKSPAYTVEQMCNWTETDLNWHMREALRAQKYRCFHIREASDVGVADLIVYSEYGVLKEGWSHSQQVDCWIELKIDNDKAAYMRDDRKIGQRGFMREHWDYSHNAIYIMFDRRVGMLAAHQGDLKGRVKMLPASPYSVDWRAVIAHFKKR